MRIRMLALTGALAASAVLTPPPAMATDTTPAVPGATTTAPAPAPVSFRNSCNPAIAALPARSRASRRSSRGRRMTRSRPGSTSGTKPRGGGSD